MARVARIIVPDLPHHVVQRGNRRAPIFFEDGDQKVYLRLLAEQTRKHGVAVWAYCLMPNHVHLILTPSDEAGLGRAVGEAHRRYTNFVNGRAGWSGHLFQSRFSSAPMDEDHLIAAVRYVSLNPVRARLIADARAWPWSSVGAHLAGVSDALVDVRPVLDRVPLFADLLHTDADDPGFSALRSSEGTGRPIGNADFIAGLERRLGRPVAKRMPGRKPRAVAADQLSLPGSAKIGE